jgi:hypothetical protein
MDFEDPKIQKAVNRTHIIRPPKQTVATFGITNIHYYLVTEPVYRELNEEETSETVLREGQVIASQPRVVTPYYLKHLEGFSDEAKRYFNELIRHFGHNSPGLYYAYKNEPKNLQIITGALPSVVSRINQEIDSKKDKLTTIIRGEDELWDVSLLKFIYELTRNSINQNISQLNARGLLDVDSQGVPVDARLKIEEMFTGVITGAITLGELKDELERWDLFEEYQDRFFDLTGRRRRTYQ